MKWLNLNAFPIVLLVAAVVLAYGGFLKMAGWSLVMVFLSAVKPSEGDQDSPGR